VLARRPIRPTGMTAGAWIDELEGRPSWTGGSLAALLVACMVLRFLDWVLAVLARVDARAKGTS